MTTRAAVSIRRAEIPGARAYEWRIMTPAGFVAGWTRTRPEAFRAVSETLSHYKELAA